MTDVAQLRALLEKMTAPSWEVQDDLEQRVQHLITQPWSSLEAARAIIPMVLEHAAKVAEAQEAPFDEHMDCQMCHGFDTAAAQIAAAIRAIGAP